MKAEKMGEWRNAVERQTVEEQMRKEGYVLTGVYGGIGTFGGREVGVFEPAEKSLRVRNENFDERLLGANGPDAALPAGY